MNEAGSGGVPPVLMPPQRVKRWRWWMHLLLLAAYPLVIGLSGWSSGEMAQSTPALTGGVKGLLVVCGWQLVVFGAVFGVAWLASRASKEELLLGWRPGFWPIPLGMAYSVGIRLGLGFLLAGVAAVLIGLGVISPEALQGFAVANRPDVEAIVDVSALRDNPVYFWLCLTLVSFVVAGLREELWRSGVLAGLGALRPATFGSTRGRIAAAAIAAIIFGFGHLPQGVVAVFLTTGIGMALGCIMVFHRSIWPAVIAHGMFDATSLALMPWAMERLRELPPALCF